MRYVKMTTSKGDIFLALNAAKAPETVKNFMNYVSSGHYNGTVFHRVIDGFMIQGGGFDTNYVQKKTNPPIKNEAANGLKNDSMTIAMARTGVVDSATCQFFINVNNNDMLNHREKSDQGFGYCVFGNVIAGEATVKAIKNSAVARSQYSEATPKEMIVITEAVEIKESDEGITKQKDIDANYDKDFEKNALTALGYDLSKFTATASGLKILTVKEGSGAQPKPTQTVKVHYTGWLLNGNKFDSSRDRGEPIEFGLNQVIPGWTEGVGLMKTGGRAILYIPYQLGYGEAGYPGAIPPKATLIFDVELLGIR